MSRTDSRVAFREDPHSSSGRSVGCHIISLVTEFQRIRLCAHGKVFERFWLSSFQNVSFSSHIHTKTDENDVL